MRDIRHNQNGQPNGKQRSEQAHGDNGFFEQLSSPFPASVIGWKAQAVSGERALAVAFIDARTVMDRLDEVVSPGDWRDTYRVQANGTVICGLSIRVNGELVTKFDVGGRSDQDDDGDKEKAAFSDALKRAAVKWGIGRYLYSLPKQWVGYDPRKKQLTDIPSLPAWALPEDESRGSRPEVVQPVDSRAASASNGNGHVGQPRSGRELFRWLREQEQALVADGLVQAGELVDHIAQFGAEAGHGDRIVKWGSAGVALGFAEAERFISGCKGEPVTPINPRRGS